MEVKVIRAALSAPDGGWMLDGETLYVVVDHLLPPDVAASIVELATADAERNGR
jgi:hypothetical protein